MGQMTVMTLLSSAKMTAPNRPMKSSFDGFDKAFDAASDAAREVQSEANQDDNRRIESRTERKIQKQLERIMKRMSNPEEPATDAEEQAQVDEVVNTLAGRIEEQKELTGTMPTPEEIMQLLQGILNDAGLGEEEQQKITGLFKDATTAEGVQMFADALAVSLMNPDVATTAAESAEGADAAADALNIDLKADGSSKGKQVAELKDAIEKMKSAAAEQTEAADADTSATYQDASSDSDQADSSLWEKLSTFNHSYTVTDSKTGSDVTSQLITKLMGEMTPTTMATPSSEAFLSGKAADQPVPVYKVRDPLDVIQFAKLIENSAANSEKKLIVQLKPYELGKVQIELVEQAGKVTAKILTDNEQTRHLFAAQAEQIKEQLSSKGIVIETMEFSFNDTTGKQAGDSAGDAKKGKQYSGNRFGKGDAAAQDEQPDTASGRTGIYA